MNTPKQTKGSKASATMPGSRDLEILMEVKSYVALVNDDCEEDEERDHILALIDKLITRK